MNMKNFAGIKILMIAALALIILAGTCAAASLSMAKRNDIFGLITKLIQRVQPEDIKISTFQKRLEPFWFVVASSRYSWPGIISGDYKGAIL
jgi:hypothetical protein